MSPKNVGKIIRAKPISIKRFFSLFHPYISYLFNTVKKQFPPMVDIGQKFGGWVADTKWNWTRTIPHLAGVKPITEEVRREGACITHHPSHTATPRRRGSLSINLEGSVSNANVFVTWQIQIATAHVLNLVFLYHMLYLVN